MFWGVGNHGVFDTSHMNENELSRGVTAFKEFTMDFTTHAKTGAHSASAGLPEEATTTTTTTTTTTICGSKTTTDDNNDDGNDEQHSHTSRLFCDKPPAPTTMTVETTKTKTISDSHLDGDDDE